MKITTSILASAVLFGLVSCSETTKETTSETTSTQTTEAASQGTAAPATSDIYSTNPQPTQPEAANAPAAVNTPASGVSVETPAGMNPPHGQPGHDCAVAVGAPLNSKGKSANALPQITTSQEQVSAMPTTPAPQPATAPVTTAPGMNPPHGQPGHDCAIAVGAPLKK